ncbi:MAG: hypothetical protein U0573_09815 [Phycisphaerales bacterium]|nr:hypothetical protein [Planctomycetota bacterium]
MLPAIGAIAMSAGMGAQPVPYQPTLDINPSPNEICPLTSSPYLASPDPYPLDVDDSRRPGFGGKEWQQLDFYGGDLPRATISSFAPGQNYYGASQGDDSVVYVRLSSGFIAAISPWEEISPYQVPIDSLNVATRDWIREYGMTNQYIWAELEQGRQDWLRERGYTYSVRTFTGNANSDEQANNGQPVRPVTVMERPTDQPKFKQKMQVRAPQPSAHDREMTAIAREVMKGNARISMPPIADKEALHAAIARSQGQRQDIARAAQSPKAPTENGDEQAKKVATR